MAMPFRDQSKLALMQENQSLLRNNLYQQQLAIWFQQFKPLCVKVICPIRKMKTDWKSSNNGSDLRTQLQNAIEELRCHQK